MAKLMAPSDSSGEASGDGDAAARAGGFSRAREKKKERGAREERGNRGAWAAVALLTTRAGSGDARGEVERRGRPEQARHGASASRSLQGRRKMLF